MSTTASPPSNPPHSGNTTANVLLSLVQDPRQVRDWVSVTPNWLRSTIVAIGLLSATFALAIRHAADEQFQTIKTIQEDSAPSIVAGQRMRASLADMHCNLANGLLGKPGEGDQAVDLGDAAPSIKDAKGNPLGLADIFKNMLAETSGTQAVDALKDSAPTIFSKRRCEAARFLVVAAKNITYPGEVPPVWTILNELARYEECAGRARVLYDQGNAKFLAQHQEADEIMRTKLLPAIDKLIDVNQRELDGAYVADKTAATVAWQLVLWSGAALLAALVGLKVLLYKRMRRVVNPPLLTAALLTAVACLWALVVLWQSAADIKVATKDAFDSIATLEKARAKGYDANGDESRWLLNKIQKGDAEMVQFYDKAFKDKAKEIADYPGHSSADLRAEIARTQKVPAGLKGHLADELNNITFPHELGAAEETLRTFLEYLDLDRQIRDLKDEHAAVELCLGSNPGQSNWAFDQFDKALHTTIEINRTYFDSSLVDAADRLSGLDWLLPLGLALAVSLLTYLGVRPRLNEYAIY